MATEDYINSNPFEGLLTSQEARNALRRIYEHEYIFCNGVFQRIFLATIESGKTDILIVINVHNVQQVITIYI